MNTQVRQLREKEFHVISGEFITEILATRQNVIIDVVRDAYLHHHAG